MCVCVCVCLFSNLAWRWSWGGGGSWVGGWPSIPHPLGMGCVKEVQGASGASEVHFGKNFIKQKLQGAPDLVGAGHLMGPPIWIRKDLALMSFWSHGHSLWRITDKIKVVVYIPNSYLVRSETPTLPLGSEGGQKGGLVGFWSLSHAFWQKLYKTKVAGHPQLSGGRSSFQTPNPDLEGPWPCMLLEAWCLIPKESLLNQSCSACSK